MMRKMENKLSKDEVIAAITDILVGVVGWIEKDKVLPTAHCALDLHINGDDLSMVAMQVEKHFRIESTQDEWSHIGTVEQVADLVLKNLPQSR